MLQLKISNPNFLTKIRKLPKIRPKMKQTPSITQRISPVVYYVKFLYRKNY